MITVIGATNIDYTGKSFNSIIKNDSNPGSITISFGGVGRNITENLAYLGNNVYFITLIGNDELGKIAKSNLEELGVIVINPNINCSSTSFLCVNNNDGSLDVAVCDTESIKYIDIEFIKKNHLIIKESDYLVIDTNIDQEVIDYIFDNYKDKRIICDAVSVTKSIKLIKHINDIYMLKVNKLEYEVFKDLDFKNNLIITNGSKDLIYINKGVKDLIPVLKTEHIVNSNGCGDSLLAGIVSGLDKGLNIKESINLGLTCAKLTLEVNNNVNSDIRKLNW